MVGNRRGVWRWVWCWLSVLAAGCGQGAMLTPITVSPSSTLPGYTHTPPTITPILRVLRTPSLAATVAHMATLNPSLTPQPLTLDPPTCHETPVGSLWCLGLVRNSLALPVETVIVRIYLVTFDGNALSQNDTLIARSALRPGESAPYGVLFDHIPGGYAGPVAALLSANPANNLDARSIVLDIRALKGEPHEAVYHLSGQATNVTARPVQAIMLVVTLFDSAGRVTGYRQVSLKQPVPSGASVSFELDVIPQGTGTTRYEVACEGQPG